MAMVDKMLATVPQLSLFARPQFAAQSARALRGLQKAIRTRRCQTVAGNPPPKDDDPVASEGAGGDLNRRRMIIGAGSAGLLANVKQGQTGAVEGPPSQAQTVHTSVAARATPAAELLDANASRGMVAYRDARINHGLATSVENRALYRLNGLLPPGSCPSSVEVARAALNLRRCATPLDQYRYLMSLLATDEDTFYATAIANLPALTPVLYTPTVGDACLSFSTLLPRPAGVYVSAKDKGRVRELLDGWPSQDVRVAVITDGERILGLGDLGANGMGIPTGKCMMYVAAGGMHPSWVLPVTLDVGTETASIREDPFYIGTREKRIRGQPYDDLVDELVLALQDKYGPQVVVHWEDFNGRNSFRLLEKYRPRACTFNDDIQSTAAIVVACLLGSLRITGRSLKQQRVLFFGAGQANIGTANLLTASLMAEGVPERLAVQQSWLFDSKGLVYLGREAPISAEKMTYAHPPSALTTPLSGAGQGLSFLDAVRLVRPTAIFGAAAKAKVFTREVVELMSEINERPVIFALSNPISLAECTAQEAAEWSGGRAVFASGSAFPPTSFNGTTTVPAFANNAFVFPGIGLGVVCSGATRITDSMFYAAAKGLAGIVSPAELGRGTVCPDIARIREAAVAVAAAVAATAVSDGVASQSSELSRMCLAGCGSDVSKWKKCIAEVVYKPEGSDSPPADLRPLAALCGDACFLG